MATSKVTLKLLVDTNNHKVVYAEAGKGFVDFLFALLSLPLSSVASLLEKNSVEGCLGDLHRSVQNLSETFFQNGTRKDSVLKPTLNLATPYLLLPNMASDSLKRPAASRLCCESPVSFPARPTTTISQNFSGGFVKDSVTYMVTDNLEVSPLSTIAFISLLNKSNVQKMNALEEKTVDFGMTEGLELLKATMQTKSVLTSVFLQKKESRVSGKKRKGA